MTHHCEPVFSDSTRAYGIKSTREQTISEERLSAIFNKRRDSLQNYWELCLFKLFLNYSVNARCFKALYILDSDRQLRYIGHFGIT